MHDSAIAFVKKHMATHVTPTFRVLEVGSRDVNGSPRDAIVPLAPQGFYIGLDIVSGKGVDLIVDFEKEIYQLPHELFTYWDLIICTEVLEHTQNWQNVIRNIHMISQPGGLVLITARGPGFPKHGYPEDYWRFTVDNFRQMFLGWEVLDLREDDSGTPGVLFFARRPGYLNRVNPAKVE